MRKNFTVLFMALFLNAFTQIPTDNIIGYYPFSGNAKDISGNGYDGVVHGATLTSDRHGDSESAYSFNGESDYIDLSPFASAFRNQSPISVSLWVKSNTDKAQSLIGISDSYDNNKIAILCIGNGTTDLFEDELIMATNRGASSSRYTIGFSTNYREALLDDNWHHMVFIFDGLTSKIFLDKHFLNYAVSEDNNGKFGNISNADKVIIGSRYTGGLGAFFKGSLDEILIYNRALDSTDVSMLFDNGRNICYKTITVTDTLVINANLSTYTPVAFENTIKIYPNPAKDHIYLVVDEESIGYQVKIVNILSQVVYQSTINQTETYIDLNTWTGKGTYIVQIFDNEGDVIGERKLILQ